MHFETPYKNWNTNSNNCCTSHCDIPGSNPSPPPMVLIGCHLCNAPVQPLIESLKCFTCNPEYGDMFHQNSGT